MVYNTWGSKMWKGDILLYFIFLMIYLKWHNIT